MLRRHLVEEKLTRSLIGAFYDVYNTLGFGFLEHIYKEPSKWNCWRWATALGAR